MHYALSVLIRKLKRETSIAEEHRTSRIAHGASLWTLRAVAATSISKDGCVCQPNSGSPLVDALANEILEEVFAYCSTSDLLHLSLVNRRISNIASRFLYRTIPTLTSANLSGFLTSVYFYEHRAPLVLALFIRTTESNLSAPFSGKDLYKCIKKVGTQKVIQARHVIQSNLTLLAAVLKKLHNLGSLQVYLSTKDCRSAIAGHLLAGCSFQLRAFQTNLCFDVAMGRFLQTQVRLATLWLDFHPWFNEIQYELLQTLLHVLIGDPVPPSLFPANCVSGFHLTTVGWSCWPSLPVLQSLMEGRGVNSAIIDLTSAWVPASMSFLDHPATKLILHAELGPCAGKIKVARVVFGDRFDDNCLTNLRISFDSLHYLKLYFPEVKQPFLDTVASSAHQFENLQDLVVSGPRTSVETWKLPAIAEMIFGQSDRLTAFAVAVNETGTVLHRCFRRVDNDASKAYTITENLAPWADDCLLVAEAVKQLLYPLAHIEA